MTKRIARTEAMTMMPPNTTSREERRSRRIRRDVRARLTVSRRGGGAGVPSCRVWTLMATLLDLVALFFGDRRRDREVAVLDDALLAVLRKDQLHELAGERIERLARRSVDVHEEEAPGKPLDRKSTRLNSSHVSISYAVFC